MESSVITDSVNGDQPAYLTEDAVDHVQLGDHDYAIYEQRVGYLENKLKRTFAKLAEGKIESPDDLLGVMVTGNAYRMLKVFIGNKLMPEWEFHGYPTEEAWRAGDYDAKYDKSPGPTQTKHAISVCMKIHSLDLFKTVADFFPKETRDAIVNELVLAGIGLMKQSGMQLASGSPTITPGVPPTSSGTTASTTEREPQTDVSN